MTAPLPPVRVEYLATWLREHRGAFTDDALRDKLVAGGHAPADVEAALELVRAAPTGGPSAATWAGSVIGAYPPLTGAEPGTSPAPHRAPSPAPVATSRDDGGVAVLAFLGAMAAIVGLPLALANAGGIAPVVGFTAFLLTLVGWGLARDAERPMLAKGLGAAVLIVVVVPIVAVVALWGYCLVHGGGLYG